MSVGSNGLSFDSSMGVNRVYFGNDQCVKTLKDGKFREGDVVRFSYGETVVGDIVVIGFDSSYTWHKIDLRRDLLCISNPEGLDLSEEDYSSLRGKILYEESLLEFSFSGLLSVSSSDESEDKEFPLTFSNILREGEEVITEWVVGIVIACGRHTFASKTQYNQSINYADDTELSKLPTQSVRIAFISAQLFESKEDFVRGLVYKDKEIPLSKDTFFKWNCHSDIIRNVEDDDIRKLLLAILIFTSTSWDIMKDSLSLHNINLCYLPCHFNELSEDNSRVKLLCRGDYYTIEKKKSSWKYKILPQESTSRTKNYHIEQIDNEDNFEIIITPSLYESKDCVSIYWNEIGFDVSSCDSNATIDLAPIIPRDIRLHKDIKLILLWDLTRRPSAHLIHIIATCFGKEVCSATYFNIFQQNFDGFPNIETFNANELRRWYYTSDSILLLFASPLGLIQMQENFIEQFKQKSFLGKNSILGLFSQDYSLNPVIKHLTFSIGPCKFVNYSLKEYQQLQCLPRPKYVPTQTMDLSSLELFSLNQYTLSLLERGEFKELDLSHNDFPYLPPSIANKSGLQKVNLNDNPFSSVPEIYRKDWKKMKPYLQLIEKQSSKWNTCRLMLLGQEGVGKTSIVHGFKSNVKRRKRDILKPKPRRSNLSTNGIEIHTRFCLDNDDIEFDIWDFGGQEIFYPTHQFFLSNTAVYLIVFRFDKFLESRIEYWLNTVKWITNDSTNNFIFFVGTHADIVTDEGRQKIKTFLTSKYRKQQYKALQSRIFEVNSHSLPETKELYKCIEKVVLESNFLPIRIPDSWSRLITLVSTIDSSTEIITWEEFKAYAIQARVPETDVMDVIRFVSGQAGRITFLGDDNQNTLGNYVILQPQWFVDILASVITFQHNFIKDGTVKKSTFSHILTNYPKKQHEFILDCLQKFNVIIFIEKLDCFIAPSLLPEKCDLDIINEIWPKQSKDYSLIQGRKYEFSFLPIGYMMQVLGRILLLDGCDLLHTWRNGIVFDFKKNERAFIDLDPDKFILNIKVRCNMNEKNSILSEICYIIDTTLAILYNIKDETRFKILIPCSNCLLEDYEEDKIQYFTFSQCVQSAMNSENDLICHTHANIPLSITAPDVLFSFTTIISEDTLVIGEKLGSGGFGDVYCADWNNGDKGTIKVAIKELSANQMNGDEMENTKLKFRDFFSEVCFMKQLKHKCIVSLHGIRLNPLGMIMEYLPNGNLFTLLSSPTILSWSTRIRIAYDIAEAMAYMESCQLVHRDLRTENILIASLMEDSPVRAKLADFGLSRQLLGASIELGHDIWQYNPPERLQDNIYDIKSDVYSFSICCWEIASRKIPYQEWDDNDKYFKVLKNGKKEIRLFKVKKDIINGLRPAIELVDINTPTSFIKLIKSCWEGNPNDRPSFIEVAETLRQIKQIHY